MYRLERIVIRGFRGQVRPIELDLQPDANFLIGRNGTGKTTLINMIHAGLAMDLPTLRESNFDRIEYTFKKHRRRAKPKLTIIKEATDDGQPKIIFRVAQNSTDAPEEYVFARARVRRPIIAKSDGVGPAAEKPRASLRDTLSSIYQTTWLSLQRGADKIQRDDEWEDDTRPDVDRKLDDLSNSLTRYFSRLDRQVSEKTQEFQKEWFLSFLATDRKIRERDVARIDEISERDALHSIFSDFNMEPNEYYSQMDRHFKLLSRAKSAFRSTEVGIPVRDYQVAIDVLRLHALVEQWQILENSKELIYGPKYNFEKVASEMLFRKKLLTNNSNQIVVNGADDSPLELSKLSSGEKQLLIFLSETLLQEQRHYIFMADEPELSMHVEWQEDLVPALLKINPNAQVIFATHSPDIVNVYQDNVFRMEDLVD
ncbi:AAA family ATPase [Sphingobium sp. AP49]|uniref:AAA family ATPase n=1 Tax=Sphingobium sp. AP49 TaxID=1144307 RepID=UPI0002E9688A|nr:AAA family ATPase [Sphingobium sp. AP49]WHO38207.1 AAA family ATPase [Sphingobium sp. AP49]